jgi:glycosyltransferase involved in cell wall biosynthesis
VNVLMVTPAPPARDGIADYAGALIEQLQEQGAVRVSVLAPRPERDINAPHLSVKSLRSRKNSGFDRLDVIHVQFAVSVFGPRVLLLYLFMNRAADAGVPVVITAHEVSRDLARMKWLGKVIYKKILAKSTLCIVHNAEAAHQVTELSSCSIAMIPHFSASPELAANAPSDIAPRHMIPGGRVLLLLGFIHVDKGYEIALEAFANARIRGGLKDVTLVIAGTVRPRSGIFRLFEVADWLYLARLHYMVSKLDLVRSVRFTGYVESDALDDWLFSATFLLLPYRRCEDSGVANLAIARGTQVIASDLAALAAYTPGDLRFPVGDAQALADLLIAAMVDPRPIQRAMSKPDPKRSLPEVAASHVKAYERASAATSYGAL